MKTKILITLLAIVTLAGCTMPSIPGIGITPGTNLGAGNGLEIISFSVEPSTVFGNGTVRLVLESQNKGGTTVPYNKAFVYLTGTNINLSSTDEDSWHGKNQSAGSNDIKSIRGFTKNMTTDDAVKGTTAVIERFMWNLIAPTLPAGQTRQDTFIARIYNNYSSGVNGNIWVYTQAEADATKSAGRALKTSSFTTVVGPVAVSVKVTPDPVILYGETTFTFNIQVTNTASGTIYKDTAITDYTSATQTLAFDSDSDLNHVYISVDSPGLTITECIGDNPILGGKSLTSVCTAAIQGTMPPFKSFPVSVMAKYGYYTESEVSVTVQGK